MQTVILENLSKTYPNGKQAVRQISLSLNPGEIYGFLGPNGAGKTSTVKLLTGMLTPSAGRCAVLGTDPAQNPAKAHENIGVVTEHAQMYDNLTGLENLIFYASVFGISSNDGKKRASALLEQLGLQEAASRKLATYSTGMRQRLSLARALIHQPKALFLDEPTSGLDPESAQNVNQLIRELSENEAVTVFLCTHQLRYAQEICSRFGLIENGRLLASGTLKELQEKLLPGALLKIRADRVPDDLALTRNPDNLYETQILSDEDIPAIIRRIVETGGNVYSVAAERPTLEDIYFSLTAENKEEQV